MSIPRALSFASLVFLALPAPVSAIDWQIETVDTEGVAGIRGSLALDSQGTPHIVYMDQASKEVRYATRAGAAWSIEVIGRGDDRASATTIILPGDVPAFTREGSFWYRSGQAWIREDMGGFSPWISTVAPAPDGTVYGMTQWSWGSGEYKGWVWAVHRHADSGTNGWSSVELTGAPFIPESPNASMVVDAQGNPHMSLTTGGTQAAADDSLRYWRRANGAWSGASIARGTWSSIALDAQGLPRISFYEPNGHDLMLAIRWFNGWFVLPLQQDGDVGLHTSQAIRDNVSLVSYYDRTWGDLKLAIFTGTQLSIIPVDTEGDVGAWTSLALDADGRPHIAYHDVTNGALKYAVGNTPLPARASTLGRVKSLYRR